MGRRLLGVDAALVDGRLLAGDVEVVDGTLTRVGLAPAGTGRLAAPGYVDLQVNGFAGVDLMSAGTDDLHHLATALLRHGVTSWMPTLVTAEPDRTERALPVLTGLVDGWRPDHGARPLGVHLEGPFLHPDRLGTHPAEHRRDPDPAWLHRLLGLGPVAVVTLAPELPGGSAMVADLSRRGVLVSLGHSDATAAQAHAAFDAGARTVTHLFNAMRPLGHREPGLPGAALARPDVVLQLVVDGHHLADDVVRLVWAAAPGRVVLVTDATAAADRGDGAYELAGRPVRVVAGAVRDRAGALAGSALTMALAVRGAVALGLDLTSALTAATTTPADLLGRRDLGRLRPGARADVVVLREDLTVAETWLEGRPSTVPPLSRGR